MSEQKCVDCNQVIKAGEQYIKLPVFRVVEADVKPLSSDGIEAGVPKEVDAERSDGEVHLHLKHLID